MPKLADVLVDAGLLPVLVPFDVVFVLVPLVEFASGPVKKKLPAIGLPNPSSCAKSEILKLFTGVDELTKLDTAVVKFDGWMNSNKV